LEHVRAHPAALALLLREDVHGAKDVLDSREGRQLRVEKAAAPDVLCCEPDLGRLGHARRAAEQEVAAADEADGDGPGDGLPLQDDAVLKGLHVAQPLQYVIDVNGGSLRLSDAFVLAAQGNIPPCAGPVKKAVHGRSRPDGSRPSALSTHFYNSSNRPEGIPAARAAAVVAAGPLWPRDSSRYAPRAALPAE